MKETLNFLGRLARNNNREWFNAHKDEYLDAKAKTDELAARLVAAVTAFEPEARYLTPADCTYRIYRDTRFSADKTPYKTHIGIFINPPYGKKSNRMGYYLHIEPSNCFIAAGTVCLPSKTISAIRKSIFENVDEYLEIIESPGFKAIFPEIGENLLKTAPKGIPRDWEHIDLVRPRDYVASCPLADSRLSAPGLVEEVAGMFSLAKPFNDFINYAIDNPDAD